jgi:hypothetical protein
MNKGVETVLARMDSNPEEFWGGNDKWKFIYSEYFRDAMTEAEKGLIFDKLKLIRNDEFTHKVMATLLPLDEEELKGFGKAPMLREGSSTSYKFTATDSLMAKKLGLTLPEYAKRKKEFGL